MVARRLGAQARVDLDGIEGALDLGLGREAELIRLALADRVLAGGDVGEVLGVGLVPPHLRSSCGGAAYRDPVGRFETRASRYSTAGSSHPATRPAPPPTRHRGRAAGRCRPRRSRPRDPPAGRRRRDTATRVRPARPWSRRAARSRASRPARGGTGVRRRRPREPGRPARPAPHPEPGPAAASARLLPGSSCPPSPLSSQNTSVSSPCSTRNASAAENTPSSGWRSRRSGIA